MSDSWQRCLDLHVSCLLLSFRDQNVVHLLILRYLSGIVQAFSGVAYVVCRPFVARIGLRIVLRSLIAYFRFVFKFQSKCHISVKWLYILANGVYLCQISFQRSSQGRHTVIIESETNNRLWTCFFQLRFHICHTNVYKDNWCILDYISNLQHFGNTMLHSGLVCCCFCPEFWLHLTFTTSRT